MKWYKKMLIGLGLSALTYYGWKAGELIAEVTEISKDLPEYFKNNFGERPKFSMTIVWKMCKIKLSFSSETIKKNPELELKVKEYIEKFYPKISKLKISISIEAKKNEEKVEKIIL